MGGGGGGVVKYIWCDNNHYTAVAAPNGIPCTWYHHFFRALVLTCQHFVNILAVSL